MLGTIAFVVLAVVAVVVGAAVFILSQDHWE